MGVTLYGDINPAAFKNLAAAYFGDTPVKLYDSAGIAIVGATLAVAPTVQRQPSILPATAGIGDSVTLDLGAASGTPTPAATWDFTLDGSSIKSRLDSGAMTIELAEAGTYALSVIWTNSADAVEATTASLLVQEDDTPPVTPGIDYTKVALAYLDAGSSFAGTAADVTSITASGTGNYVFTKAGTGVAIQRSDAGFVFGDGAYVQTQVLSNQPTTDGLFAVVDVTLTSYGSNLGQLVDGTGVNLKLRNSAGSLQALGPVAGQGALTLGAVTYGTRLLIGGLIDDVLDVLRGINSSGATVSAPHAGLVDPLPTRFTTGRYVKGTLHRLVIVGRPEGQDWPVTIEQVYEDFRRGGVTAPRPTVTSLDILPVYGQSENRSSEAVALSQALDATAPEQIYYTFGMVTEAGRPVDTSGAGWGGSAMAAIDQTHPGTGFASAAGLGRVSPAFTMQYCRAARWRAAGHPEQGAIIGDHGYGGRFINEWRRDDASPIGRNQQFWVRESKRLADSFGVEIRCPYVYLFQGSSAKDQAGAAYRADFDIAHGETVTLATELFGAAPKLVVVVNGADVNTIGDIYATPGVQYRIALDYDGIIATWQRIYPINDQNAHVDPQTKMLIGETSDWAISEVEAGRPWNITYAVQKSGTQVVVRFALRAGETLMQRAALYDAYGGAATCPNFGFEAEGGIVSAVPDFAGDSVVLTLASASAGWLRFAHQVQDCYAMTDAAGYTMSAHRTTLFGSETRASRLIPGQMLWRALPGFRGSFSGDSFHPEA